MTHDPIQSSTSSEINKIDNLPTISTASTVLVEDVTETTVTQEEGSSASDTATTSEVDVKSESPRTEDEDVAAIRESSSAKDLFGSAPVRRPSLSFLEFQKKPDSAFRVKKPLLVLPEICSAKSLEEQSLGNDTVLQKTTVFDEPGLDTSISPILHQKPARIGTSSSFLLGRSTDSGRIRFTPTTKPREEVLRRRLDQLDMTVLDEVIDDYHDDEKDIESRVQTAGTYYTHPEYVKLPSLSKSADPCPFIEINELPDIEGLRLAVEIISIDKIHRLYDACRYQDPSHYGRLSASQVLRAIIDVVPGASRRNSVWRKLIVHIAPNDDQIVYGKLLRAISKMKTGCTDDDTIPTIADLLISQTAKCELPNRPSTSQKFRERGRAQVMLEIETLLVRNPQIDIDRLKLATSHKIIDVAEMTTILDVYGLHDNFQPFLSRLLNSFRTNDNRFHFSAFVGCLDSLQPSLRASAPATLPKARWEELPLGPITPTEDQLFEHDFQSPR